MRSKSFSNEIDHKQVELEQAQRQGNWEAAARIQYGEMRDLQRQIDEAEARLHELMAKRHIAGEGRSDRRGNRRGRFAAGPASPSPACSKANAKS